MQFCYVIYALIRYVVHFWYRSKLRKIISKYPFCIHSVIYSLLLMLDISILSSLQNSSKYDFSDPTHIPTCAYLCVVNFSLCTKPQFKSLQFFLSYVFSLCQPQDDTIFLSYRYTLLRPGFNPMRSCNGMGPAKKGGPKKSNYIYMLIILYNLIYIYSISAHHYSTNMLKVSVFFVIYWAPRQRQ